MSPPIEVAGCVVYRTGSTPTVERVNGLEVLLVRDRKDGTWGFPRGHVNLYESWWDAATRETLEESGYLVEIESYLGPITYFSKKKQRPKQAHYFSAVPVSGSFVPNDEIDRAEWLTIPWAARRLHHEREVNILDVFLRYVIQ